MCDIIPLRLLPSLIFCGAIYPMLGLRSGAEHWGLFTATYILSMLTASVRASSFLCLVTGLDGCYYQRRVSLSHNTHQHNQQALCLAASSAVPIFAVANLLVALLYILMMTSAGVLINFEQLPKWARALDFVHYT